jgi:hypothetical protein
MFCKNCGVSIDDDAKFCSGCGSSVSNSNTVPASAKETHLDNQSERDITLLHLYDLRMLEMAKAKLNNNWIQVDNRIKNLGIAGSFDAPRKGSPEVEFSWIFGVFAAAVALLGVGWFIDVLVTEVILGWFNSKSSLFMRIGTVLAVILAIIGVIMIIIRLIQSIKEHKSYQQRLARYNSVIANDQQRVGREIVEQKRLIPIKAEIHKEWEKVGAILKKAYSVNLIPEQYRNLYAVYYLNEYLSTSQESLRDALLHCNLHYNFEAIKQKLDAIYHQVSNLVIEQAITNARLENIQEQNENLLEHAIKTANNTAKAAQYSQIAAANTEAMVYIGIAQYISQNF